MAEYYLISQLPSLDGPRLDGPLPITEEAFLELCRRHLSKRAFGEIERLTLTPAPDAEQDGGSALIRAWNAGERDLRLALAAARAERMHKPTPHAGKEIPASLLRVVGEALAAEDPLTAEKLLLTYRLAFLESLRPMDGFSQDFLFYYGLKLKLLARFRGFDSARGEAAYKQIYSATLHTDRLEVTE